MNFKKKHCPAHVGETSLPIVKRGTVGKEPVLRVGPDPRSNTGAEGSMCINDQAWSQPTHKTEVEMRA